MVVFATQVFEELVFNKLTPYFRISGFRFPIADGNIGGECGLFESDDEKINFFHHPFQRHAFHIAVIPQLIRVGNGSLCSYSSNRVPTLVGCPQLEGVYNR